MSWYPGPPGHEQARRVEAGIRHARCKKVAEFTWSLWIVYVLGIAAGMVVPSWWAVGTLALLSVSAVVQTLWVRRLRGLAAEPERVRVPGGPRLCPQCGANHFSNVCLNRPLRPAGLAWGPFDPEDLETGAVRLPADVREMAHKVIAGSASGSMGAACDQIRATLHEIHMMANGGSLCQADCDLVDELIAAHKKAKERMGGVLPSITDDLVAPALGDAKRLMRRGHASVDELMALHARLVKARNLLAGRRPEWGPVQELCWELLAEYASAIAQQAMTVPEVCELSTIGDAPGCGMLIKGRLYPNHTLPGEETRVHWAVDYDG